MLNGTLKTQKKLKIYNQLKKVLLTRKIGVALFNLVNYLNKFLINVF